MTKKTVNTASAIANGIKEAKENNTMNSKSKLEELRAQVKAEEDRLRANAKASDATAQIRALAKQPVKHTLLVEPTLPQVKIEHRDRDLRLIKSYVFADKKTAVAFIKSNTKDHVYTEKYVDRKGRLHLIIVGKVVDPNPPAPKAKVETFGSQVGMF